MDKGEAVVALFEQALQSTLGERFSVTAEAPNGAMHSATAGADLVVWPRDGSHGPFMVELKMMDKDFDLPLAVAGQTRRIIDESRALNPTLIVATTGRVGKLLREELNDQDVSVVQSSAVGTLADDLSNFILQRYDAS